MLSRRCWSSAAVALSHLALSGCARDDDLIATLKATGGSNDQGGGGQGGEPAMTSPCAPAPGSPAALSRFDFEDAEGATALHDSQGLQDAQLMAGAFVATPGPSGCGNAIAFGAESFAVIANLPEWDLESGSIELWFRVPEVVEGAYGILGRDHVGTDLPGHLSVWLTPDRTVTLRLQGATLHATHCSEAVLAAGQWVQVGFNFGPPGSELFVDGVLAARSGDPRVETVVPECGGVTPDGIAGNEQPWVLGSDTSRSVDMLDGLLLHFNEGALDAFSISASRRDFQRP